MPLQGGSLQWHSVSLPTHLSCGYLLPPVKRRGHDAFFAKEPIERQENGGAGFDMESKN